MRLEQLQYLLAVVKSGSFSSAAEKLHVAQPSVSQAIAHLESELNVQLLKRARTGVRLTKAGEAILPKAQNVMNLIDEIRDESRTASEELEGRLRISAIPSICNTFLSDVLAEFKETYRLVNIEITEDGTNQIVQDVLEENTDLGLISNPTNNPLDNRIEFNRLLTGTYMVCIGKNSSIPLYDPIPVEFIKREPIVLFKSSYRQMEYLKQLLQTDELNILLSVGYTETAKKIISDGIAIGFYPDFSVKRDPYIRSGDIISLHVESNDLTLNFGWIKMKNQHVSKAAREFITILKRTMSK